MQKSSRPVSARFRILSLAVVAIVIPGIILAGFGFKLSSEHRDRTEEVVRRAYRTAADTALNHVMERVKQEERKILFRLSERDPEGWPDLLDEMAAEHPIAEHFFLLSPDFEIQYPRGRVEIYPEPTESKLGPAGRGAEVLLEAGYQLEFDKGDLGAAASKYRTCANGPFSALLRAEALISLGACLLKLTRFDESIAAYRRVPEELETKDVPVPLRLLAQYQVCRAREAAGEGNAAFEHYLRLYATLLSEPASVQTDSWEFFREETKSRLTAFAEGTGASPEGRAQFQELKLLDDRRDGLRQFRLDLKQQLAERIEWEARRGVPESGDFSHFQKGQERDPSVVGFSLVESNGQSSRSVFGFQLDLDYVKTSILQSEAISRKREAGTIITFLDRQGNPILPLAMSEVERPGEPEEYALTREFPEILGFWQLGILDQGNERLLAVTRDQELLMTTLLGLTIGVLIVGLYLTLRDMNRELELSRLKSDFVSNVSHELKTPLSLIRMFAETLQLGRVKSEEKAHEYYEIMTRESERLTQLIDNVLDFSRIESGRKEYQFELDDVGEVVRTTIEPYQAELERQGFEVGVAVADEALPAMVDRGAIAQALLNLVNNAQKYSGDRREIRIAAVTDGDEIRVAVSDRGIGIPQADQARIFEKFFRAENDFVRSVRGSGLGLALTAHTLDAHRGRIELESDPGEGSTFTLVLPIHREPAEGGAAPGGPPGAGDAEPPEDPENEDRAGEEHERGSRRMAMTRDPA